MRTLTVCIALCVVLTCAAVSGFSQKEKNWQTGTLTQMDQEKVPSGTTRSTNTEGTARDRRDKTEYSENTTTTTSSDTDTYQVYTIEGDKQTYVCKERLLFPWSKAASVNVGSEVKFAVEGNKVYILDDEGKEHKASIASVRMTGR